MSTGGSGTSAGAGGKSGLMRELDSITAYADLLADPVAFQAKITELRNATRDARAAQEALGIAGDAALALREAQAARAAAQRELATATEQAKAILEAAERAREAKAAEQRARDDALDQRSNELDLREDTTEGRLAAVIEREHRADVREKDLLDLADQLARERNAAQERVRAVEAAVRTFLKSA